MSCHLLVSLIYFCHFYLIVSYFIVFYCYYFFYFCWAQGPNQGPFHLFSTHNSKPAQQNTQAQPAAKPNAQAHWPQHTSSLHRLPPSPNSPPAKPTCSRLFPTQALFPNTCCMSPVLSPATTAPYSSWSLIPHSTSLQAQSRPTQPICSPLATYVACLPASLFISYSLCFQLTKMPARAPCTSIAPQASCTYAQLVCM